MKHTQDDHARVIAPPPILYAGAFLLGLYLDSWVPLRLLPRGPRSFAGGILLGTATTTAVLAARQMRSAGTPVQPTHPTTALVQGGLYHFTRNPIYGAFTLAYAGLALLANRIWPLLLLPLLLKIMRIGVIEREEHYLEEKFGAEYSAYKENVPRWL
jgi:protein-S-isoprenylcysteine O-methyltransferase Ste14